MPQSSNNLTRTMSVASEVVESLTRKELVEEVIKHRTLMREVKAKMECPVCLSIPREGPVPCCPRGHLVCTSCLEKMKQGGQRACPTCRGPMGEGKSLLAKVLVENIEHQCDLKGCKEMVSFKTFNQHTRECNYRLVLCPGSNFQCRQMVPFCEVENHATTCPDTLPWRPVEGRPYKKFRITKARFDNKVLTFYSRMMNVDGEVFFVRARKEADNFIAELVMKADQQKCNKFMATISILDSLSRPSYNASFCPRPLGISNEEDACLSVRMKSLAKVWEDKGDKYSFQVCVVIKHLAEDVCELYTPQSEEDNDDEDMD